MTRIIDGRKATVINVGHSYTTFDDFAKRNGYPEAVDGKTRIKNGEVVTLLASETHGPHSSTMLWIVENADGERQVIGESGLNIDEPQYRDASVTYREVKRKAAVGERIKIVRAVHSDGSYADGSILTVTSAVGIGGFDGAICVEGVEIGVLDSEYVVLQPTLTFKAPATVSFADFQALQRKVDAMETDMKRMDTQLRVAREDIDLIEKGVSGDIERLEAAVFPSKWRR